MKNLLIVSLLFALPVAIEYTTGINVGTSVHAAEAPRPKRKTSPLKEKTYKALAVAQSLIDPASRPEPENGKPLPPLKADPRKALVQLQGLLKRRGMNAYEIAQIWSTIAFAYYTLEDIPNTLIAYENILKQPQQKISLALEMTALRALFQLHYTEENYAKAITFMQKWEAINGKADTSVTYLAASAYYQLKQYKNSLQQALRIEKIVKEQNKTMKENWLYLQVILYSELNDIDNVIKVLERMVVKFSKKQYWMHLAGMYSEKNWDDKALSAYYVAYIQNMFERESEIVMLSQRLLNAEVPFEAASILEKGFKSEVIEKNAKNIRILASAYTMAQEHDKAIDAWKDAGTYADTGEIAYRLAQALSNEDRHKEAVVAYRQALNKGGLRNISEVNFWLGISQMQVKSWNDAKTSFRAAAKDKKHAKSARRYIRYIESEVKRIRALKEMSQA